MKYNIQLQLKSLNKSSLILYKHFLIKIFQNMHLSYYSFDFKNKKKRVVLLKSPHVNKKAREHFEITYYKSIFKLSISLKKEFLKYLFLNKPKTVVISIKKQKI